MSKISDELRVFANTYYPKGHHEAYDALFALADRIDAEMAELPRGKDGKPIRVGETVYGEDGRAWHVEGITLGRWARYAEDHVVHATGDSGQWRDLLPEWLTHERQDSWERIADELDEQAGSLTKDGYTWQEDAIHDFAVRIRRLAEREASNGTD